METLVNLREYIEDIIIELRYATENNFTGKVIYDFCEAYLRKGTADKLKKAVSVFREKGYRVKVYDAYRPVRSQFVLWDVYPDDRFVRNPHTGYSNHSRGSAIDLTLTDMDGHELPMPSKFDEFSPRATRDYALAGENEKTNALLLESIMEEAGFIPYHEEWWHFHDSDTYDVLECFQKGIGGLNMSEVLSVIKERRSIRAFREDKVSKEDLKVIAEAGLWAPTANNRQTFQLTVLDDYDRIQVLAKAIGRALGNDSYNMYKPQAIIMCSNLRLEDRGTNAVADVGCVMENMFLQARAMGIGSCWINQLNTLSDEPEIRELLNEYGIPENHVVWAIAALGYEVSEASAPERKAVLKFVE